MSILEEKGVFFSVGSITIEGLLSESSPDTGVVITHPHPLYGGSMHSSVVEALVRAFQSLNLTTLRFNFRGTGRSTGRHDNGIGEQEDVKGAIDFLKGKGLGRIYLAGYSYGTWINTQVMKKEELMGGILVAPPVDFFNFDFIPYKNRFALIVCGDSDQYCATDRLISLLGPIEKDVHLKVIKGCDHFFVGKEGELEALVKRFKL
nr:alpha/beta hydrolase [Desulfobacterales bacterium]